MLASGYQHFRELGVDCDILSIGPTSGPFAPFLQAKGYRILNVPFSKRFKFLRGVRRVIAEGNYDIVHIHCERAYLMMAICAVGKAPVVRTVHHLFRFDGVLRQRKTLQRAFCRRFLRVTELNNSRSGLENERRRYHAGGILAPNWFDDSVWRSPTPEEHSRSREALGVGAQEFLLVSLGTNNYYKNYHAIVEAIPTLVKRLGSLKYIHVGNQGSDRPLSKLASELGVEAHVAFAESVDSPLQHIWAADCYVMPSLEEGFGVAAIEALATGVPSVLSNRPALCDFGDYFPGIFYVEPTTEGVIQGVSNAAALSDEARVALRVEYAKAALDNFGSRAGVLRYVSVYRDRLAKGTLEAERR